MKAGSGMYIAPLEKKWDKDAVPINFSTEPEKKFYRNVPLKHRVYIAVIAYIWKMYPSIAEEKGLIKIRGANSLVEYLESKSHPWKWYFEGVDRVLG